MARILTRRSFLRALSAGASAAPLLLPETARAGGDPLLAGNRLAYRAHRLLAGGALAPELAEKDLSPVFRTNGNTLPSSASYRAHAAAGFADWRLVVDGRVGTPRAFSLAELRSMPARSQITLHNCVEGWTAVGKWKGAALSGILRAAGLLPDARYIVFHCADDFDGEPYYESIDLDDAFHPQTILAYEMNGAPLPIEHGAPIRLRVERQLGYKHAKFVMRVEAVDSLSRVYGGQGGYWEDSAGYDWYAGI